VSSRSPPHARPPPSHCHPDRSGPQRTKPCIAERSGGILSRERRPHSPLAPRFSFLSPLFSPLAHIPLIPAFSGVWHPTPRFSLLHRQCGTTRHVRTESALKIPRRSGQNGSKCINADRKRTCPGPHRWSIVPFPRGSCNRSPARGAQRVTLTLFAKEAVHWPDRTSRSHRSGAAGKSLSPCPKPDVSPGSSDPTGCG
jgi:hypothetical protein